MEGTNQQVAAPSHATVNPFMVPQTHLQRMENLNASSQGDHQDLEKIKQHLKNCQVAPELQEIITLLVYKLEATLKEKDELVMAENSRGALLMGRNTGQSQSSTAQSNYETDDDILDQETNWTKQESRKKKRKKNESLPKKQESGPRNHLQSKSKPRT
ncbi:hypothetical protein WDU94_005511 [Cyamophila willieti]